MLQKYYRLRLHDRSTWIPILAIFLFSIVPLIIPNMVDKAPWDVTFHFFDAHFASFFFYPEVAVFQIPLYFIYLLINQSFFSNVAVYLRFSDTKKYWNKRFLTLAIDAALFVLFLYLLLLSRFVFFQQTGTLQSHGIYLLKSFFSQCLGYFLLGVFFSFLSFLFKNPIFGMFCTYAIVAVDYIYTITHNADYPIFFLRAICINPFTLAGYWPTVLLMVGISIGIRLLAPALFEGKDFLSKEVS